MASLLLVGCERDPGYQRHHFSPGRNIRQSKRSHFFQKTLAFARASRYTHPDGRGTAPPVAGGPPASSTRGLPHPYLRRGITRPNTFCPRSARTPSRLHGPPSDRGAVPSAREGGWSMESRDEFQTQTALLRQLADLGNHEAWRTFQQRYQPMMERWG